MLSGTIVGYIRKLMTETQYLTSTNPAEMVAFLGERITDEHRRFFVEACRNKFAEVINITEWDSCDMDEMRMAFIQWVGWSKEAIVSKPLRADILRDIVGNPFRPYWLLTCGGLMRGDVPNGYGHGEHVRIAEIGDWLNWNDRTIPLMVDAMMFEECGECNRGDWPDLKWIDHCDKCKGTQRIPRAEPRWEMMLEIADALEDGAGCRDQHILEHLRSERDGERCPHCQGEGWIPNTVNMLSDTMMCLDCEGEGRIKRGHWRGCHIVELLSQKS